MALVLGPLTPLRSALGARPRRKLRHDTVTPGSLRLRSTAWRTPSAVIGRFLPNHSASVVSAPTHRSRLDSQRTRHCAVLESNGAILLRPVLERCTTRIMLS